MVTKTFDPVLELQKLRDHLSSHDKPLAFLFGAGTSCSVRAVGGAPLIPAVTALTDRCAESVAEMGPPFSDAWELIRDGLPPARRDVEEMLSSIRRMIDAILDGETSAGLNRDQITQLEKKVKATIAAEVKPHAARFPAHLPHERLGRWLYSVQRETPVEIFSLNYDTLIERGLEAAWVPYFDGFIGAYQPFFSPASLTRSDMFPGRRWTRLYKLHGSVTWSQSGTGDQRRVIRGDEQVTGEMILPSLRKYEESRKQPYLAMLDRLRDVLTERDDIVLIVAGYSFADQHVNEIVFEALKSNPGLHVFALCFADPHEDSILMSTAGAQRKLVVLAPNRAVISSQEGSWKVTDPKASAARLANVFDLDGGTGPTGKVTIGDFNSLCHLLDGLAKQSRDG